MTKRKYYAIHADLESQPKNIECDLKLEQVYDENNFDIDKSILKEFSDLTPEEIEEIRNWATEGLEDKYYNISNGNEK